jgi:sentrin-specific protease 8
MREAFEDGDISSKAMILLPVNNNSNPDCARGGSHWSLLVFAKCSGRFYHFDSSPHSGNLAIAQKMAERICMFLTAGSQSLNLSHVESKETPLQTNMSDCGVYVLAISSIVAREVNVDVDLKGLSPDYISNFRKDLHSLISGSKV